MRLSPALNVRHWLAKLHPPLPQTPRESQQLLRILEGSFQKHLDETHPSPVAKQISNPTHSDIPLTSVESSSVATRHFLNSLLSNPLLAKASERSKNDTTISADAVDRFVKASSQGDVTIPLVRGCAKDYLDGLKKGEAVLEKDQFAPTLALWISTTNLPMREAFLKSRETLDLAVRVTGADGQEAIAWNWLKMVYECNFSPNRIAGTVRLTDPMWLSVEDDLVSYIMRLSIRRGDLNDAAQQYVEACRYRSASGRAAARLEDASLGSVYIPMQTSWKRLAAAVIHYRRKHGISSELFDRALLYGMQWSSIPQFSIPILNIYHPTSPSALTLSQHLEVAETANQFLAVQNGASRRFRGAMLMMILDGAQVCLDQGHRKQAQFLLDFARAHYQEFLPASPRKVSSLDVQIQDAQGELQAHSYHFALG